jgi:hypothetical protein
VAGASSRRSPVAGRGGGGEVADRLPAIERAGDDRDDADQPPLRAESEADEILAPLLEQLALVVRTLAGG